MQSTRQNPSSFLSLCCSTASSVHYEAPAGATAINVESPSGPAANPLFGVAAGGAAGAAAGAAGAGLLDTSGSKVGVGARARVCAGLEN